LAWRSAIQGPHLQTDRDVGAASVIVGLLGLHDVTADPAYMRAAVRAGDWLLAVAQRQRGGLTWPDHVDRAGHPAADHYTSFDDGTPGIADSLWRLWAATGDRRYRAAAIAGMRWMERVAQSPPGSGCPRRYCRWRYETAGGDDTIRTGMGEGNAGIVYAFDVFAQRTGDRGFKRYAIAGASYLRRLISRQGAMPWGPGRAHFINGFLSGSAGDAFMFMRLYTDTHDAKWLATAQRLLAYVRSQGHPQAVGENWPIYRDSGSATDPAGNLRATGIEEGAAGIGWVELQAYHLTRDPVDLRTAIAAGDWLLSVAASSGSGDSWPEDLNVDVTHTSLDNGAPGIGWFLHDLAAETGQARYEQAAQAVVAWLGGVQQHDSRGVYWDENLDGTGWHLRADPSWHWGIAGIAGFLARMAGWGTDMPGEEPGLPSAG
jgi:lantibiotic modifying enzyme